MLRSDSRTRDWTAGPRRLTELFLDVYLDAWTDEPDAAAAQDARAEAAVAAHDAALVAVAAAVAARDAALAALDAATADLNTAQLALAAADIGLDEADGWEPAPIAQRGRLSSGGLVPCSWWPELLDHGMTDADAVELLPVVEAARETVYTSGKPWGYEAWAAGATVCSIAEPCRPMFWNMGPGTLAGQLWLVLFGGPGAHWLDGRFPRRNVKPWTYRERLLDSQAVHSLVLCQRCGSVRARRLASSSGDLGMSRRTRRTLPVWRTAGFSGLRPTTERAGPTARAHQPRSNEPFRADGAVPHTGSGARLAMATVGTVIDRRQAAQDRTSQRQRAVRLRDRRHLPCPRSVATTHPQLPAARGAVKR